MSRKWFTQDDNPRAKVKVSSSYNRNGKPQTDILVFDKKHPKEHAHIVYDDSGDPIYVRNPWKK